jgi:hypothetical protein
MATYWLICDRCDHRVPLGGHSDARPEGWRVTLLGKAFCPQCVPIVDRYPDRNHAA